jgi:hypothetical protein
MVHRRPLLLVGLLLAVLLARPGPADAAWRVPVDGPVVGRFTLGPDPFAAGQRRGVDLAAPVGTAVVAPCAGRVTFAGALPRRGGGVAIRCGPLSATVLGLAATTIRRGAAVAAGDRLGVVGAAARIRLGARRGAERFGYLDPLTLLGPAARAAPPVAGSRARRPGRGPGDPARRPARPAVASVARPSAPDAADPAASRVPLAGWAGLGLAALALPVGAVAGGGGRRRRAHRAPAVAK